MKIARHEDARSAGRPRSSRALRSALRFALAVLPATGALALDSVKPREPADGATTGPMPVFRFAVAGAWGPEGRARIELSRDHWRTVEHGWDMRESTRGWTLVEEGERAEKGGWFLCPETLPEGAWEWRVQASNGGVEVEGPRSTAFRVDATPPAEVSSLRLERRRDGAILLAWDPVLYDVEGKPETVDHYVVYRYDTKGIFTQPRAAAVGEPRAPFYLDRTAAAPPVKARGLRPGAAAPGVRSTLYYKVVAVDSAGNELGRRETRRPASAGGGPENSPLIGSAPAPASDLRKP